MIDVSAVCGEVALLLRRTFDRTIDVQTDIAPRLRVAGESLELHQVLMNLCLNARDAMPVGGTLSISAKREEGAESDAKGEPTGVVIVTVSDDGEGMEKATKSQIFEPFFTTKKGTGFGLGLATVRDIVSLLGGEVTVESEPGAGAKFVITLPAANRRGQRRVTSSIKNKEALVQHAPMTILLVDDEEMVRRSMMRVLTQAGHEVLEASGGNEAVSLYAASDRPPDLVLLDLDMPNTTGEETLKLLLELDANCKVIMVSGHGERGREMSLRETGALGFLHKPWRHGELMVAIDKIAEPPDDDDERPTRH
jgi:two-component system cell cycle sensor histidine kinase/response regulator CckA